MPDSSFTIASGIALTMLVVALLVIVLISSLERRLVAGAALLLAGLFQLSRPGLDFTGALLGTGVWALGAGIFFRAGFAWTRAQASRAGPLALVFVLPAAFLGAILFSGVMLSILAGPVRLAVRLLGG